MCLKKDKLYKKRENEKRVMFYMINLYCKHHHKDYQKISCKTFGSKPLCKECEEIYNYSIERTCPKQCYKTNIKNKVKQIMSFSGKIMLIYHPIIALKHVFVMIMHNFIKNKRVDFKGIIVVPILPTTPFLLLASFFFAKGSKKFHDWFMSTKLYKKHLESFVNSRAMTLKSKLTILLPVSCMLIATFIFVNNLHARILLVVLFIGKYLYFFTQIKTIKE